MYLYLCPKCGTRQAVLRSFSDYETPPTEQELELARQCPEGHKWERELGNSTIIRGPSFGSKGNW